MEREWGTFVDPITGAISAGLKPVTASQAPTPSTPAEPKASDAAKALAEQHGIDLATITGTGADGNIIVGDVQAVVDAKKAAG